MLPSSHLHVPPGVNYLTLSSGGEQMRISSGLIAQTGSTLGWRGGGQAGSVLHSSVFSMHWFSLICSFRAGTQANGLTGVAAKAPLASGSHGILTLHGRPFGKDGDGPFGHPLLANHGGDFGAPAVRTHPQEVTRLVVPLCRSQNAPVRREQNPL